MFSFLTEKRALVSVLELYFTFFDFSTFLPPPSLPFIKLWDIFQPIPLPRLFGRQE